MSILRNVTKYMNRLTLSQGFSLYKEISAFVITGKITCYQYVTLQDVEMLRQRGAKAIGYLNAGSWVAFLGTNVMEALASILLSRGRRKLRKNIEAFESGHFPSSCGIF